MKKTYRYYLILLLTFGVVSCQGSGLDQGQQLNQELTITATIAKPDITRVSYEIASDITPSWSENDLIFGFDNLGNTFTFKVSSVDPTSGKASFSVVDTYNPGSATKAYAIYAPGKTISDFEGTGTDRTLAVDLSSQNGILGNDSPVLMCATGTISGGNITFSFVNKTAIVGVTRFKMPTAAVTTIKKLKLEGAVTTGVFSVSGESIILTPGTTPGAVMASGTWKTNAEGLWETNNTTNTANFAVMPTDDANLSLGAIDNTDAFYSNVSSITQTDLVAGEYYYFGRKLGARVAEVAGVKYATIDEAWAVANAATSDVTVTLLANCSAASTLKLDNSKSGTGAISLDLNGKELTGPASSYTIDIRNSRSLTVCDNSTANVSNQGSIVGVNENHTVYVSASTLTINGGKIVAPKYDKYSVYLASTSEAIISGGRVVSDEYRGVYVGGTADLTINGGEFNCKNFCIYNYNTVEITDGVFNSVESAVVTSNGSTNGADAKAAITGGFFYRESEGELFTQSSSAKCYVQEAYVNRPVNNARAYTVDGSTPRSNTLNDDEVTKTKYPYKVGDYSRNYYTRVPSYNYNHASFSSAARHANSVETDVTIEVRVNLNKVGAVTLTNPKHKITLDLAGKTLSTSADPAIITTSGELNITGPGIITSSHYYVIRVEGASANVNIENCTIKSTNSSTTRTTYVSPAAIYIYDSETTTGKTGSKVTITGATIYTENKLTAISNRNGTLEITDSEVSSGTSSTGMIGVSTGDNSNVDCAPSTTINSGFFYCSNTEGNRPAAYLYGSNSRLTINGGYYYSEGTRSIRAASGTLFSKVTVSGGYYNKSLTYESYSPTIPSGYSIKTDANGSCTHSVKGTLSFGYQVAADPSEGEAQATLGEPVASYGAARTGGVSF